MPIPLSLKQPFSVESIQNLVRLGVDRDVWLLEGFMDDKIVVKWEKGAAGNKDIKGANPAIKAFDKSAALKVLVPQELNALRRYVENFEEWARDVNLVYGTPPDKKSTDAVSHLKRKLNQFPEGWLKMEFRKDVTDLGEAYAQRMEGGDKANLRKFVSTLNAPGSMERLGQILAVDLFIKNGDRFNPEGSGGLIIETPLKNFLTVQGFRVITGPQNVFRMDTDSGSVLVGLDFIYQSPYLDINKPLREIETAGHAWWGRILADKNKREQFAKDVVHDLEKLLSPRRHKYSLKKPKLNSDSAKRVEKGMVEGARLIRERLALRKSKGLSFVGTEPKMSKWTQGVEERYLILCQVR